jgi:diamine N-acetyltransferase
VNVAIVGTFWFPRGAASGARVCNLALGLRGCGARVRVITPADHRVGPAELGILIGERRLWGKGLGGACSRWMVEYGFRELNLPPVYLEVLETNRRAQDLYARLGLVVEGRLRQHQLKGGCHVDVVLMGLRREEYAW